MDNFLDTRCPLGPAPFLARAGLMAGTWYFLNHGIYSLKSSGGSHAKAEQHAGASAKTPPAEGEAAAADAAAPDAATAGQEQSTVEAAAENADTEAETAAQAPASPQDGGEGAHGGTHKGVYKPLAFFLCGVVASIGSAVLLLLSVSRLKDASAHPFLAILMLVPALNILCIAAFAALPARASAQSPEPAQA